MSLADLRKIANFRKITVFFSFTGFPVSLFYSSLLSPADFRILPFYHFTPRLCALDILPFYCFAGLPGASATGTP